MLGAGRSCDTIAGRRPGQGRDCSCGSVALDEGEIDRLLGIAPASDAADPQERSTP